MNVYVVELTHVKALTLAVALNQNVHVFTVLVCTNYSLSTWLPVLAKAHDKWCVSALGRASTWDRPATPITDTYAARLDGATNGTFTSGLWSARVRPAHG